VLHCVDAVPAKASMWRVRASQGTLKFGAQSSCLSSNRSDPDADLAKRKSESEIWILTHSTNNPDADLIYESEYRPSLSACMEYCNELFARLHTYAVVVLQKGYSFALLV
jgi:hypothetical protein